MSNLVEYNTNFLLYPFGLYNNSIICYFNSLLQSLFSCTSITHYFLHNEKKYNNNNFIKIYIHIIKKYINNINNINDNSNYLLENQNLILFNEFLNIIKNKNITFGYNQEDSGELLILLLEIINDPYINNLFMHKYQCDIYCKDCKKLKNIVNDTSIQFEIDLDVINTNYLQFQIDKNLSNLNKYIRNNYSELLNYKCEYCNLSNCIKINRLINVPTIIIINLNKYNNKINYQYPIELQFINDNLNNIYKYKLISTINHSGTVNFGHYISKSIRKKHNISLNNESLYDTYLLNDNSYEISNFKSDITTYILIYHYIETVDYYKN